MPLLLDGGRASRVSGQERILKALASPNRRCPSRGVADERTGSNVNGGSVGVSSRIGGYSLEGSGRRFTLWITVTVCPEAPRHAKARTVAKSAIVLRRMSTPGVRELHPQLLTHGGLAHADGHVPADPRAAARHQEGWRPQVKHGPAALD